VKKEGEIKERGGGGPSHHLRRGKIVAVTIKIKKGTHHAA